MSRRRRKPGELDDEKVQRRCRLLTCLNALYLRVRQRLRVQLVLNVLLRLLLRRLRLLKRLKSAVDRGACSTRRIIGLGAGRPGAECERQNREGENPHAASILHIHPVLKGA